MIESKKLSIDGLGVEPVVELRSNRIKSRSKRSLVDDPNGRSSPVFTTLGLRVQFER